MKKCWSVYLASNLSIIKILKLNLSYESVAIFLKNIPVTLQLQFKRTNLKLKIILSDEFA